MSAVVVTKHLLSPGTYSIPHPQTGEPTLVQFTRDDCRNFALTGNRLIKHGFGIPVPLEHQDGAGPVGPAERAARGVSHNTGWVNRFLLDGDGGAWTELAIEDIPGTPHENIEEALRTRIKYVSPELWPSLTLGDGSRWENVVKHVALTCQPIFQNQRPFGESPEHALALSLSRQAPRWTAAGIPARFSGGWRMANPWQPYMGKRGPRKGQQVGWQRPGPGGQAVVRYQQEQPGAHELEGEAPEEAEGQQQGGGLFGDAGAPEPQQAQQQQQPASAGKLPGAAPAKSPLDLTPTQPTQPQAPASGGQAAGVKPPQEKPQEPAAPQQAQEPADKGDVINAPLGQLATDPKRFQYKISGIDPRTGVTEELKAVHVWNPDFAGVIAVWKDPANGQTYVINGHHRYELARRLGVKKLAIRHLDAADEKEARSKGALINIAEGRGTAIDAAKFLRDMKATPADFERHGISLKGKVAKDAVTLSTLSDRGFQDLTNGLLNEEQALAVARHCSDHAKQDHIFQLVRKADHEIDPKHLEEMARAAAVTPVGTRGGSLFGDLQEDLWEERADIASFVRGRLVRSLNNFKAVSSEQRAKEVGAEGNVLDTGKNRAKAKEAEAVYDVYDRLLNRKGPIAEAIAKATVALSQAPTEREKNAVRTEALATVNQAVQRELSGEGIAGQEPGVAGRGVEGGAGQGGGAPAPAQDQGPAAAGQGDVAPAPPPQAAPAAAAPAAPPQQAQQAAPAAPAQEQPAAPGTPAVVRSEALFEPEEMSLPKKAPGAHKTKEALYAAAGQAKSQYDRILDLGQGVSRALGAKAVHPSSGEEFANTLKEMETTPGAYVIIASLKGEKRATEKVLADYGGDWSKLTDVIRGTVALDTIHDIPHAIQQLRQELSKAGWKIHQQPKNKFAQPTESGYRDINLVLSSPDGTTAELQVNTKAMVVAKERGHALYEQERTIEAKAAMDKRDLTPEEVGEVKRLRATQADMYNRAWAQSTGGAHGPAVSPVLPAGQRAAGQGGTGEQHPARADAPGPVGAAAGPPAVPHGNGPGQPGGVPPGGPGVQPGQGPGVSPGDKIAAAAQAAQAARQKAAATSPPAPAEAPAEKPGRKPRAAKAPAAPRQAPAPKPPAAAPNYAGVGRYTDFAKKFPARPDAEGAFTHPALPGRRFASKQQAEYTAFLETHPEVKARESQAQAAAKAPPTATESPQAAPKAAGQAATLWEQTPEQLKASGAKFFRTAKGSLYLVHPDGTTQRVKSDHSSTGHDKEDVGLKERSVKTVYVPAAVASALSAAGVSGMEHPRVIIKDGKATLASWNKQAGRWGAAPSSRDIPVSDKPAEGMAPLELWSPRSDVPGHEAYAGMHAGNEFAGEVDHAAGHAELARAAKAQSPARTTPAAATDSPQALQAGVKTLGEAFDKHNKAKGGHGLVSLVDLRKDLAAAGYASREAQDRVIMTARRAGLFSGSAAEGRFGITAEEKRDGMREDGDLILYLMRRAPAGAGQRMSLAGRPLYTPQKAHTTGVIRLSRAQAMAKKPADEADVYTEDEAPEAAPAPEPDGDEGLPPIEGEGGMEGMGEGMGDDLGGMDDLGGEDAGAGGDWQTVANEIATEFADMGIHVPVDAQDAVDFLRHLATALKTHIGTKALHEPQEDEEPPPPEEGGMTPGAGGMAAGGGQEAPQMVQMSLQAAAAENRRLRAQLADKVYDERCQEIEGLVTKGKVQPNRANTWKEVLDGQRMSLVSAKQPDVVKDVLTGIKLAHDNPEGTFWSQEVRLSQGKPRSGNGQPRRVPGPSYAPVGEPTPERVEEILNEQYGPKQR